MPITEAAILTALRGFITPETPRTTPEIVAFLELQFPFISEEDMRTVVPDALRTLGRESLAHADELERYAAAKFEK